MFHKNIRLEIFRISSHATNFLHETRSDALSKRSREERVEPTPKYIVCILYEEETFQLKLLQMCKKILYNLFF